MRSVILLTTALTVALAGSAAAQDHLDDDRFKPRVYGNLGITPAYQGGTVEIYQPETTVQSESSYTIVSEPAQPYIRTTVTSQTSDPVQREADRIRAYQGYPAPSGNISGAYEIDLYEAAPTTVTTAPTIATTQMMHTVAKGDTLYNISKRYGTTVAAIQDANGLYSTNIGLGQNLKIPATAIPQQSLNTTMTQPIFASSPVQDGFVTRRVVQPVSVSGTSQSYAVLPKDTLYSISRRSCVAVADLISTNNLSNPNALKPGQMLTLPSGHCLTN